MSNPAALVVAFAAGIIIGMSVQSARGQDRFSCVVARTVDGDTLTCGSGRTVRIAGIDAPELHQPYGRIARLALVFLAGEPLICTSIQRDRYGRTAARCGTELQFDIGAALVRAGHAWDYTAYSRGRYAEQQELAKMERLGLWREPNPVPPWVFRAKTFTAPRKPSPSPEGPHNPE